MIPERIEADWLRAPETRAVMAALEKLRPGGSRFVGGCVRNTLMQRAVDDIDIATQLAPGDVVRAVKAAGLRAVPTGLEHGTITAIAGHTPFEITTLRRDVETDGRRAVVAFTEDWAEDAARRDFRLNAIYATADGTLHDPTGEGVADALAGRVIFIGEADERLREDYLRILRFYRFNAWYGAGIDDEGQAACARQAAGLERIAAERIWKELKKLLAAPSPSLAVEAMESAGVLARVVPGAVGGELAALESVETALGLPPDPMQRLMSLLPRRPSDVAQVPNALRLSNAEADRLRAWADPGLPALAHADVAAIRRARYRFGKAVLDRAIIEASQATDPAIFARVKNAVHGWCLPRFPLTGQDALDAGLKGPDIGKALKTAENAWIESDFVLSRTALLALLTGN